MMTIAFVLESLLLRVLRLKALLASLVQNVWLRQNTVERAAGGGG